VVAQPVGIEEVSHADAAPEKEAGSLADRALRATFKFGKFISVLVVGLSILAICLSVCLLLVLLLFARAETLDYPERPSAPSFDDFVEEISQERSREQPSEANSEGVDFYPKNQTRPGTLALRKVAQEQRLSTFQYSELAEFLNALPEDLQPSAVENLDKFLQEASKKYRNRSAKFNAALSWYIPNYERALAFYDLERVHTLEVNSASRLSAATKRGTIGFILLVSISSLLGFLVLPLLIEIEENTRK